MDQSEPALKPEWLKAPNSNATSHHLSNGNGKGISSRNGLTSLSSSNGSNRSRDRDRDRDRNSKSRAYSSFGTRSNRNRTRKQEKDFDLSDKDSGLFFDRFDSLIATRSPKDKFPEGSGIGSRNGVISKREFPSLKSNGLVEVGNAVSLKGIGNGSVGKVGGETWNSVLAEVPVSSVSETGLNLNMAETVAQVPSRDRSPPRLSIDPQRIEELTIRQCKQLIPVTPPAMKNSIKNRGDLGVLSKQSSVQLSPQPVNTSFRTPFKPEIMTKPAQLGTLQVLNREKNGIGIGSPISTVQSPKSISSPTALKGNARCQNLIGVEKRSLIQAKERHEFFNFLRNKASNTLNDKKVENEDCDPADFRERKFVGSEQEDGEMDVYLEASLDPEEEAFLRSLGWDKNAEIDALTKEEIDAFNMKYKERMQFSKLSQQKVLSIQS